MRTFLHGEKRHLGRVVEEVAGEDFSIDGASFWVEDDVGEEVLSGSCVIEEERAYFLFDTEALDVGLYQVFFRIEIDGLDKVLKDAEWVRVVDGV